MTNSPLISIVVPLFNAEPYLETGLHGILNQTYQNWELVAVNDGSTDQTKKQFLEITKEWKQDIKFIDQENGGGFAARNTGLDNVSGDYIALFDIDDRWYSNHLEELLKIMREHSEIDWAYAANKIIDLTEDEKVVEESNFYLQGKPKKFLELDVKKFGKANLITDSRAAEYQIKYGLQLGQQFSLARANVFKDYRFRSSYRNEGADQISVIRALKEGFKLAYLNEIHGEYAIHGNNASAGCKGAPIEKYIRLRLALIRGFREVESEYDLTIKEVRAINHTIANNYFWQLGYNLTWPNKEYKKAFSYFKKGIYYKPLDWKFWKTYLGCLTKKTLTINS